MRIFSEPFLNLAMAAIGSLLFCTACGNLLPPSTGEQNAVIVCDQCGTHNKGTHLHNALRPLQSSPAVADVTSRHICKDYNLTI